MLEIGLLLGDITKQRVDAIVNAANFTLLGGAGVDGAIHAAAGPALLEECRRLRATTHRQGLLTGHAVATGAGDLAAKWVIHTVGPIYGTDKPEPELLRSCYLRSLEVADQLGARTVAFPSISTGAFAYPLEEAAPVALAAVRESEPEKVGSVTFVLFDQQTFDAYSRALEGPR